MWLHQKPRWTGRVDVLGLVGEAVVVPVVRGPPEDPLLRRRLAEEGHHELPEAVHPVGPVGEVAVEARGDREHPEVVRPEAEGDPLPGEADGEDAQGGDVDEAEAEGGGESDAGAGRGAVMRGGPFRGSARRGRRKPIILRRPAAIPYRGTATTSGRPAPDRPVRLRSAPGGLGGERVLGLLHPVPHRRDERLEVGLAEPFGRDRREDPEPDPPREDEEAVAVEELPERRADDRDDRDLRRDREVEGPLLERQERRGPVPVPLREDPDRDPLLPDPRGRRGDGRDGAREVLPVEEDVPRRAEEPAEDRDLRDLLLPDDDGPLRVEARRRPRCRGSTCGSPSGRRAPSRRRWPRSSTVTRQPRSVAHEVVEASARGGPARSRAGAGRRRGGRPRERATKESAPTTQATRKWTRATAVRNGPLTPAPPRTPRRGDAEGSTARRRGRGRPARPRAPPRRPREEEPAHDRGGDEVERVNAAAEWIRHSARFREAALSPRWTRAS